MTHLLLVSPKPMTESSRRWYIISVKFNLKSDKTFLYKTSWGNLNPLDELYIYDPQNITKINGVCYAGHQNNRIPIWFIEYLKDYNIPLDSLKTINGRITPPTPLKQEDRAGFHQDD